MSDYLCEELIIEIFTRLPAKSLLRFRSLSKSVCSFIDSPCFIREHTFHDHAPQKAIIIEKEWWNDLPENYTLLSEDRLPLCPVHGYINVTTLEFPDSSGFEIVGSCNGILCLFSVNNKTICLWNPSIRRELTMRDRPSPRCKGNVQLGFGFDPVSKDYKILRISYNWDNTETSSFVYTMKTESWCKIDSPTIPFNNVVSKACFVNGKFHWVVEFYDTSCELGYTYYILTFDLGTNTFGSIELPERDKVTGHLTHINGSLSVMYTNGGDCRIWVRREYDNTANWHSDYKIIYGVKKIMGLNTNGNFVLIILNEGFKVHNLETGGESRLVKFKTSNPDADRYGPYGATCWKLVNSLVLCNDSLELLITGTAYKGTQLSCLRKKKK